MDCRFGHAIRDHIGSLVLHPRWPSHRPQSPTPRWLRSAPPSHLPGNDQQSNRWRYHPTGRISSRAGPRLAPSQRSSATPLRPINPCAVADPTCSKTLMQLSSPRVPPAHPPAALTCHLLLSISLGKLHQEVQLAYLSCQVGHVQMPPIGVQPAPRSAPSCPGSPDVVVCAVREPPRL